MSYQFILPLLLLGAFFWFMSRTQRKQRERQAQMQNNMQKGSQVVTIGGLHAVVDSVDQEKKTVDLDAEGVILTFDLNAIRSVTPAEGQSQETTEPAKDDSQADSTSDDQATKD